jgi:uracil-DNA glycosylase family 4
MNFAPAGCTEEPLAEGYSRRVVPTFSLHVNGRQTALLVLGEAPGKDEDKAGEPFVGWSGQLLRSAYIDYWKLQDHADVFLSNAVRCRPPGNRTPKPKEIKAHAHMLHHDLAKLNAAYPQVFVLCVGATACRALGLSDTLRDAFKCQGGAVRWSHVVHGEGTTDLAASGSVRAYATFHPASLRDRERKGRRRGPSRARTDKAPALEAHLSLLKRALSGQDPVLEPEYKDGNRHWIIAPGVSEITALGVACSGLAPLVLCCDTETYGCIVGRNQTQFHPKKSLHWDNVPHDKVFVSASLAWDGGAGFYNLRDPKHRATFVSALRWAQRSGCTLLFHNLAFDVPFLRRFLPAARPCLEPPTKVADLMIESHMVDDLRPERSLKALAPLMLGQQGLYTDEQRALSYTGPDDPDLARYNVADVERTLECYRLCREAFPRIYGTSTNKGSPYADDWSSKVLHLVTHMTEVGIPIDEPALRALDHRLRVRLERIERLAREVLGFILSGKRTASFEGSDTSKRSAVSDAAALCPDEIAAQVVLTKTGKFPYDEVARALLMPKMQGLAGNPPRRGAWRKLHVLGMHQGVAKLINTYTGPMLRGRVKKKATKATKKKPARAAVISHAPRVIRGRIYPTWYPVPREFGDTGQEGGTRQIRFAAKDPSVPTFPPCIKDLLQIDIWADYSGIELRTAALLSGDPVMMSELSSDDGDLHARTTRIIFGDAIIDHPQFKSKYRQAGKRVNFLMLYLGGADKLQATVLDAAGIYLPLSRCRKIIADFWAMYPGLRAFLDGVLDFVRRKGYYELPLTGHSRLFDRTNPPINECANFPFQATAAAITICGQSELLQLAQSEGVGMNCGCNIYDAVGIELHSRERQFHGARRALALVDRALPCPSYYRDLCSHLGRTLPLAYEVKELKHGKRPNNR